MALPMAPLVPFSPIDQVTPFSYRDNDTYLSILSALSAKVETLIVHHNALNVDLNDKINTSNAATNAAFNQALIALRDEIVAIIANFSDEGMAYDPTDGSHDKSYSQVLGQVYDNLRIYGITAGQYESLNLTAAEYDALEMTARHYDLGAAYPVFNDVTTTKIESIR